MRRDVEDRKRRREMSKVVFDYQFNFNSMCFPCTKEMFHNACKSSNVKERIRKFREQGDGNAKRGLPAVCWQAHYADGKRLAKEAVFSGLFQLDIDHVENPLEMFNGWWKGKDFDELGILLVFITPSGKGLKVVCQMKERAGVPNTIPAHQKWLSEQLGLAEFDASTKDLARMAFVPLDEDILYENPELWDLEKVIELDTHPLPTAPTPQSQATAPLGQGGNLSPSLGGQPGLADYNTETHVKGSFTIAGRPMVDYVLGWFTANGGYPEQGQRNNTIYRCALYFRNFTDYNPKVLAENIPS